MEIYRIGKVVSIGKTSLIFEWRYSGEIIYAVSPQLFKIGKVQKIYIFRHQQKKLSKFYGFITLQERTLFQNLMFTSSVKPQMALNLLRCGVHIVINWITNVQVEKIAQVPLWNNQVAHSVVMQLRDKYSNWITKLDFDAVKPIGDAANNHLQKDD